MYLEHIKKFAALLGEVKTTINGIKDNWVTETGYAFPSGLVSFNAAFRCILKDLEVEREDVENFIAEAAAINSESKLGVM